ncbi:MAG TPA: hypothetical protein VEX68_04250 [Bryobacteraceae bacterium]|nr:hypothetical protein [Bryobacteraceae bacterium]
MTLTPDPLLTEIDALLETANEKTRFGNTGLMHVQAVNDLRIRYISKQIGESDARNELSNLKRDVDAFQP